MIFFVPALVQKSIQEVVFYTASGKVMEILTYPAHGMVQLNFWYSKCTGNCALYCIRTFCRNSQLPWEVLVPSICRKFDLSFACPLWILMMSTIFDKMTNEKHYTFCKSKGYPSSNIIDGIPYSGKVWWGKVWRMSMIYWTVSGFGRF